MSAPYSRNKRILILLMAVCLFMSLTVHTAAASMHPAADDCKIKSPCWACAVSVGSDSPEIKPAPLTAIYYSDLIIAAIALAPESLYHPPR